ncbi:MAG: hypothetical protein K9L75_00800 [Spirochaetia bacterium]|nr:hypothetical protein [Spirochaetia bacterium]
MNYYLVGICGTGMSNLAVILHLLGHTVSGSDADSAFYTYADLKRCRIQVFTGFSKKRITNDIDALIYSSAYKSTRTKELNIPENSEILEAEKKNIKTYSYAEMAGALSEKYSTIAVAGTHGKTTTSMMLAYAMRELHIPALVLAGTSIEQEKFLLPEQNQTSVNSGLSPVLILEACEYQEHFLLYSPDILVLTNIDYDHVDYYPTAELYRKAFLQLIMKMSPQRAVLYNPEDYGSQKVMEMAAALDYSALSVPYGVNSSNHSCVWYGEKSLNSRITEKIQSIPRSSSVFSGGKAFQLDGAAAFAACGVYIQLQKGRELKDAAQVIARGISSYPGARRRLEQIGEAGEVLFFDDYAHHPKEIQAALEGLRSAYPQRRLVVDFIPHTISRTKAFEREFAEVLAKYADIVFLQEIYASIREASISEDYSSRTIADRIEQAVFFPNYTAAMENIPSCLKRGDLFITMGAGDNRELGISIFKALKQIEMDKEKTNT